MRASFIRRGRAGRMNSQRAIIDIGSNTVRLVVYGPPLRAPIVLHNEKVTARLGRNLAETGLLGEKAMKAALVALGRFAVLLRLRGISAQTVATAAVRDAANGPAFLAKVAALGLEPRLLSGEEEAVLSARGVMAAFPGAAGVVADLGGGSLELIDIAKDHCKHGVSLPLGTLRLPQLRAVGPAKFRARVAKALRGADWSGSAGQTLYLVGGSHRAFARFAMQQLNWPLDDPHGFEISPEEALRLCRLIGRSKLPLVVPGLSSSRLASLTDTAALLGVLLQELNPDRLIVSGWGLREGLLYNGLDKAVQTQNPLLAGAAAFAEQFGIPAATAAMVAGWTASANPADGEADESLRLAATMLVLAAGRLEPNLRGEHAIDWALRKRWIGLDPAGRAMIAATALANAGKAPPLHDLERLAVPQALREAQAWGLAIRLCRRFGGLSPLALSNSALSIEDGKLLLTVREPFEALYTDATERDLRQLAERLGLAMGMRTVAATAALS